MLLQSLLRPVLTPLMRGMFDAPIASSAAWSPLALWPNGIATPGMWISPRTLTSEWQDYTGTTPVVTPGTVADSSNPVGLALDIRAGATVLTDPGNHMLQATSTARPLLSARVNSLTFTEDFSTTWTPTNTTIDDGVAIAPDGSLTATKVTETTADGYHYINRLDLPHGVIGNATRSIYLKAAGRRYLYFYDSYCGYSGYYDCETGIFRDTAGGTFSAVDAGNGWWRFTVAYNTGASYTNLEFAFNRTDTFIGGNADSYAGDGVSGIYVWADQCEHGTQATDYQPILTDGSTYPSTGFPIAQKYDGTDDGMATAAFAAGTLINGMDCMIVVRRDSAASVMAGIHASTIAGEYTGLAVSGAAYTSVDGAGAPTVWVDGVQLTGGTAVTAGTLYTALTVGDWHILEYRNLDLSGAGWTIVRFSQYNTLLFNGPRGDIMLFPSTASTEDKDAARQWLADYYGVTLP